MAKMVHDDGEGLLNPVMEKDDLCIFDEGDILTVRKRGKGILKKIDKKTVTEEFWDSLREDGWMDVDIDEDEEDEEE